MNELSWLEIHLSRLDGNVAAWRALLAGGGPAAPKLCAVVKANAYGLGAVPVAQRLARLGVDMLAVYTPAQAEELVEAQVPTPVLILQPARAPERTDAMRAAAVAGRVHLAINDPGQLGMADVLGRALDCRIPAHLHLDTGMSRAGLNQEQLVQMLADLPRFRYVRLAGLWSHLATAGDNLEFAYEQLARLEGVLAAHAGALDPDLLVHIAATHAACRDRRFHRGMVRVGLGLYGHGPDMLGAGPRLPLDRTLEPVLRWLARVIHVQSYRRGTPVGYGCTHHLRRDSVLGVVPVGYADGYPQALGNKGLVRVVESDRNSPVLAPVVGAVSMDQIVIDLTDAPGVRAGATVELVSNDPTSPLSLPKLAAAAGSTPYEVLCRLSPRLPREYVSIETVAAPAMPARLSVPGAV